MENLRYGSCVEPAAGGQRVVASDIVDDVRAAALKQTLSPRPTGPIARLGIVLEKLMFELFSNDTVGHTC